MSLNIKNHRTYELVRELAAMKGTNLTAAVTIAVEGEIEREKSKAASGNTPSRRKRSELFQQFAREYAKRVTAPVHSWEIDSLLYDENGLPK